MIKFVNKFKIPTFLGLGIIMLGLSSGLYLVLKEQIIASQAAANLAPQNITFTNITDNSLVISWQTNSPAASFITFGQSNPQGQTVLDDRDSKSVPRLVHYVTLKNLLPQTRYQFRIVSQKFSSDVKTFETAKIATNQTIFTPVIGSVLDENKAVSEGIAYLLINKAVTQSALIKTAGNFLIPLSSIRTSDLSQIFPLAADTTAKIIIISDKGSASINFKLKNNLPPLAPVKLGQNIDLASEEINYDLNEDGKINSADYAIVLQNILSERDNENLKNNKADINKDGTVDQKDLDLVSQELKKAGFLIPESY